MSAGRVVLRNLVYGVCGEAVSGLLNFLTFILVARSLGPGPFGTFSYILALVGVFQLLADFGITNILVREVARARDRVGEIIGAMRPLAWLSSLVVVGLIAAIGWPLSPTREVYEATLLLGLSVLATFHSFSFASVCRAFEEMGFNALGNITHKVLQISLVSLALHKNTGVVGVGAAMMTANSFQWLFFYTVVRLRYVRRIVWRFDVEYWKYLLKEAVPLGLAMVLRRANQQVGILVLTALSTPASVGLFSAAYKIVQVIDMIPFTLSLPLFPPFARLAQESHAKLFELVSRALRMFLILAAPLVVWLSTMAPWLMRLIFGDKYAAAAATAQVLTLAILFLFVTALYGYLFSALGRQRFYTIASGCCVATNLVLDLLLIPSYQHLGAAVAALAAEAVFCASGAWLLYRIGYRASLWKIAVRPIMLALVVAPLLLWGRTGGPRLALGASALYVLIYVSLVLISGAVEREERAMVRSLLGRRRERSLA